jgi:DNA-binding XRE family transcriptional regulator
MPNNPIDWPRIIHRIRNDLHFTQAELGCLLMVTSQTVSNWEAGRARPKLWISSVVLLLYRICRQVDPADKLIAGLRTHWMEQSVASGGKAGHGAAFLIMLGKEYNEDIPVQIPRKLPNGKTPSVR